jgi:Ser/Thr protein kinase RdoA (MazF antagonist)
VSWEDLTGGWTCEHLQSLGGFVRGSKDLATFAASWDLGFGIESIEEVDPKQLERWATAWPTVCHGCPSWLELLPHLAAGTFVVSGSAPWTGDAVWASPVDPATWEIDSTELYDLGTAKAAPTAYYTAYAIEGVAM